ADEATQNKVVSKMELTLEQKKQNEAQADKLLASIDDYLLKELGIDLPAPPENILKNRMFTATIKEISGGRFDPFYYKKIYTKTIEAIQKGKFRTDKIKHLIIDLKNGVEIRNYVEEGIRYLRVTDLTKNGLNNSSKRFVSGQEIPERIQLNKNCILISRSGSLGLVNIVEDEIMNAILSSHIFKVELDTKQVDTIYLEGYLRSHLGQFQIFRTNNGGVIPEINQDALKSIRIVLPPLAKQKEIAEHITDIRKQAQQLKDKTKEAMEKAGKEIERILLS
ncbi:MAG: restriction endonuclease subunit S, partial [Ignavibacteria bacterium]|nr:restriction endonuclease subunit S [Ignavibacteria bacterium]